APSKNRTWPPGMHVPGGVAVTVAVKVTLAPGLIDGLEETTAVEVAAWPMSKGSLTASLRPDACAVSVNPEPAWLMESPEKVATPAIACTATTPSSDLLTEEVSVMSLVDVVTSSP